MADIFFSFAGASLYSPDADFTCLDGSATFPFRYVNDDYCDCQVLNFNTL
jgi:protein kinase C substrate 80K-H